jgi:hypothetical protein
MADADDTPLTFGKHRGKTPNEIADEFPSYVVWLRETIRPYVVSKHLADDCEQVVGEMQAEFDMDNVDYLFGREND